MRKKKCGTCQRFLPETDFTRDSSRADGLRSRCRECLRHKAVARYRDNREKVARENAAYYAANRERVLSRSRSHHLANQHQNWESKYRARARSFGVQIIVEKFTKPDVTAAYGNSCIYCGGPFESIDHVQPISSGGPHTLENVRPCCLRCNSAKGSLSVQEYKERIES